MVCCHRPDGVFLPVPEPTDQQRSKADILKPSLIQARKPKVGYLICPYDRVRIASKDKLG